MKQVHTKNSYVDRQFCQDVINDVIPSCVEPCLFVPVLQLTKVTFDVVFSLLKYLASIYHILRLEIVLVF